MEKKDTKRLIITIDTEGDNLWNWKKGDAITTENTLFLSRFQTLCEKYGFKPVWLSNYEMLSDPRYVDFIAGVEERGTGELGMHLHAWNTPPEYALPNVGSDPGQSYLIEYPEDVMEEKIAVQTELIRSRTGVTPVTHRAGRWATDDRYFALLKKYGYHVDCSVTPYESWASHKGETEGSAGSDYRKELVTSYWIDPERTLLEVPMTIRKSHRLFITGRDRFPQNMKGNARYARRLLGDIKRALLGNTIWLRPHHASLTQMQYLLRSVRDADADYAMLMMHSSELMPGGSPYFPTAESVEKLYKELEILFESASKDYRGSTLRDYYKERITR